MADIGLILDGSAAMNSRMDQRNFRIFDPGGRSFGRILRPETVSLLALGERVIRVFRGRETLVEHISINGCRQTGENVSSIH